MMPAMTRQEGQEQPELYARQGQNAPGDPFKYPSYSTVFGRVLGQLLDGETLTHHDCLRRMKSNRLAHHIFALKEFGWPIQSHLVEVKTTDHGRVVRIAEYWLELWVIDLAGERGRRYAKAARGA